MKHLLSLATICVLALSFTAIPAFASSVEDQLKNLEQDWAHAVLKGGTDVVDRYEADDITSTDPGGRVTDKAQDKKDLASGDLKFQSIEQSDMKVQTYGNTAVVTGASTVKGSWKDQDISGSYRFTDTWVKRGGKWQAVASQYTKVQQ
jgi:ketosteroid isomerase-like protein